MYAIIDVNFVVKEFFQKQTLVNFKKTWYYRDVVSEKTDKPDLKYLKKFEEQTGIKLWDIVYGERLFVKYNRYYKFSQEEIFSIIEKECRFYEKILDEIKPNFLIIRSTDFHKSQLLVALCKKHGIKVLMLDAGILGYKTRISKSVVDIENFDIKNEQALDEEVSPEKLKDYLTRYNLSLQTQKKELRKTNYFQKQIFKHSMKFFLFYCNKKYRSYYQNFGKTRLKILLKEPIFKLKKLYRELFINNNFKHEINSKDGPFIYFPLHVEPEVALHMIAPFYTNQIGVIFNIAKSLPVNFKLYVKENPRMKLLGWRELSYYKKIQEFPNVELIHPSVNSKEILEKCSLVITITGTTGFESLFFGKPSIVFADNNYSNLNSVYRLKNLEDLPQAITTCLKQKVDYSNLKKYIDFIEKSTFDFDFTGLIEDILNYFYNGGSVLYKEISVAKMEKFLERKKPEFKKLALEHVKKIKQYKENTEN